MQIENTAFVEPNWVAEDFLRYDTVVAEVEDRIVGFLVFRDVVPAAEGERGEREILNFAVDRDVRRQGIGSLLLNNVLLSGAVCFLEVRESNMTAQALYRKLGFVAVGRREKYYRRPVETAIVMQMK